MTTASCNINTRACSRLHSCVPGSSFARWNATSRHYYPQRRNDGASPTVGPFHNGEVCRELRIVYCNASSSAHWLEAGNGSHCAPDAKPEITLAQRWREFWALIPDSSTSDDVSLKDALKEVWMLTLGHRKWLLVALVSLVVAALSELTVPHLVSKAFEVVIAAVANGPTVAASSGPIWQTYGAALASSPELKAVLAGLMLAALGETIFTGLRAAAFSLVNLQVVKNLRAKLFATLVSQDVLYFDASDNNAASLSSRLSADCLAVTRLITINLNVALRNSVQALGGLAYLTFLNAPLALGCIVTAATTCIISVKYGRFQRRAMRASQDALAASTSIAEEALSSMRVVRAHGYEGQERRRYSAGIQHIADIVFRSAAAYCMYVMSEISLWHVANLFVLAAGGAAALAGAITPAELTAFVMYSEHVLRSCLAVCEQIAGVMENVGSTDTVLKMLRLQPAPQVAAGVCPPDDCWELGIRLQNVEFSYPTRQTAAPALDGVSLQLDAGSTTALVGRSGSGKSTLVQLLTRQTDPDRGTVALGSHDLRAVDAQWFRRSIAIVPQEPSLFSATVRENIAYGVADATDADIEAAAAAANAHDFIQELPEGYDTPVSDSVLSGGQRQRIAIARALLRDPKLLVLDEATSALDASSEAAVQEAIENIMADRSRTVVVIAHRLSTVRTCDSIVVMDAGAVAEQGTHDELMRLPEGIYRGLVVQQANGRLDEDSAADGSVNHSMDDDCAPLARVGVGRGSVDIETGSNGQEFGEGVCQRAVMDPTSVSSRAES